MTEVDGRERTICGKRAGRSKSSDDVEKYEKEGRKTTKIVSAHMSTRSLLTITLICTLSRGIRMPHFDLTTSPRLIAQMEENAATRTYAA